MLLILVVILHCRWLGKVVKQIWGGNDAGKYHVINLPNSLVYLWSCTAVSPVTAIVTRKYSESKQTSGPGQWSRGIQHRRHAGLQKRWIFLTPVALLDFLKSVLPDATYSVTPNPPIRRLAGSLKTSAGNGGWGHAEKWGRLWFSKIVVTFTDWAEYWSTKAGCNCQQCDQGIRRFTDFIK